MGTVLEVFLQPVMNFLAHSPFEMKGLFAGVSVKVFLGVCAQPDEAGLQSAGRMQDIVVRPAPQEALDSQSPHVARINSTPAKSLDEGNPIIEVVIGDEVKIRGNDRAKEFS